MMRILGLIPARGGSKGVPRKNIAPLGGKPLLAWTAEAALTCHALARVVLSTDDHEIAQIGRSCGLQVPFMRPTELAQDETPTLPVIQHAVRQLAGEGDNYEAVCLLQPTHPLRPPAWIEGCIDLLASSKADCVFTAQVVPPAHHPWWVYMRDADGALKLATGELAPAPRRQDLPPAFCREGSVYVTRTSTLINGNSLYGKRCFGYLVPDGVSINIDTPADLARAESQIAGLKVSCASQDTSPHHCAGTKM